MDIWTILLQAETCVLVYLVAFWHGNRLITVPKYKPQDMGVAPVVFGGRIVKGDTAVAKAIDDDKSHQEADDMRETSECLEDLHRNGPWQMAARGVGLALKFASQEPAELRMRAFLDRIQGDDFDITTEPLVPRTQRPGIL